MRQLRVTVLASISLGNLCTGSLAAALVQRRREGVGVEGACLALAGRLKGASLRSADHRAHLAGGGSNRWRTA